MISGLRRWFGIRTAADDLLDLMLVAQDDNRIRQQLLLILSQEDFQRQSLLNTWVDELVLSGAPKSLIRALKSLIDNDVAHRAQQLLITKSAGQRHQ